MFTLIPGQLVTKEQHDKDQPQKIAIPHSDNPLGRLLEVLTVKGLIDIADALYVSNMGERPNYDKYKDLKW
jgi:hypothetical protein